MLIFTYQQTGIEYKLCTMRWSYKDEGDITLPFKGFIV